MSEETTPYYASTPLHSGREQWVLSGGSPRRDHYAIIEWLSDDRDSCVLWSHDYRNSSTARRHNLVCFDMTWHCDCEARAGTCWHRTLAEYAAAHPVETKKTIPPPAPDRAPRDLKEILSLLDSYD